MGQKSGPVKEPAEQIVKEIPRATWRQFSAQEKIRIVLSGLRGKDSIAELCRREGIVQNRPVADNVSATAPQFCGLKSLGDRSRGRSDRTRARSSGRRPRDLQKLILSRVHRVRPELVAEVKFLAWTEDNLLRQVVYEGLREDKPAVDVCRPIPHAQPAP
jgi:hypothetical protein